jgi:hypothetical protein
MQIQWIYIAPEAASEKIKHTINKHISEDQLLETVDMIFSTAGRRSSCIL